MRYIRTSLFLTTLIMLISGCGGGSDTISANLNSNSGGTSGTGGSSGLPSGGVTGTLTLQWAAPASRADNTSVSLSEISGYRLYYGTSATNTPYSVNISDGSITSYKITLPLGVYYFRIAAIDSNGYEGLLSSVQKDTI